MGGGEGGPCDHHAHLNQEVQSVGARLAHDGCMRNTACGTHFTPRLVSGMKWVERGFSLRLSIFHYNTSRLLDVVVIGALKT
jgi:hypothetical protein